MGTRSKGDLLWEGDLVYEGDENSPKRKFRIKLFYAEPNNLGCSTFNWLSGTTQVKLSKFPFKLVKKSDVINGVKVSLKDFIRHSQVLSIEVSPDKDLKDWLQTDGMFYGFIRPEIDSWTPLVLVLSKPKTGEGNLAVFCVESPIIKEKETGKFKQIELSEHLKDPRAMFKYFEDTIVKLDLEQATASSSRSDSQSISHGDQVVTDSGETGTGSETSPDKSWSVDKSDETGQNHKLSTVAETEAEAEEGNLPVTRQPESGSPAASASLEDIDVAPILERVVDTQSSQATATSGDCDQANDGEATIAINNEENNIGDIGDKMTDQTERNISSVAKDSENEKRVEMLQNEPGQESVHQEDTSYLDQPQHSVQVIEDHDKPEVIPPSPNEEKTSYLDQPQDSVQALEHHDKPEVIPPSPNEENTSYLDQPQDSVQVLEDHDEPEVIPPSPNEEDTSYLDQPQDSVLMVYSTHDAELDQMPPPMTPAVSPPRLPEDHDAPELIPPSPAPAPKIRLRTDLLSSGDQLGAAIQDVLEEEEEEEVCAPEFSLQQGQPVMPPPGYHQSGQQLGVAVQETRQLIQTQTRTYMCQPPGPGGGHHPMQNQQGAMFDHQQGLWMRQQQTQVPMLRQQLQGTPPNQDYVVPSISLNPRCRNPTFSQRLPGTQGANIMMNPSGQQIRQNQHSSKSTSATAWTSFPQSQQQQQHGQAYQRPSHQQQQLSSLQQPQSHPQHHIQIPHPQPQSQTHHLQPQLQYPHRPFNFRPGLPSSRQMDTSQVYVQPRVGVSRQISPPATESRSMDSSQVYVHGNGQQQQQPLIRPHQQQQQPLIRPQQQQQPPLIRPHQQPLIRSQQQSLIRPQQQQQQPMIPPQQQQQQPLIRPQQQQQPYPAVGPVFVPPGPTHLDQNQRTPLHREIETSCTNTGEIVTRKIAANVAFISTLWQRCSPNIRGLLHQLLSRESQNNEAHLWMMIFQESGKFNMIKEFYLESEIMEHLRKWYASWFKNNLKQHHQQQHPQQQTTSSTNSDQPTSNSMEAWEMEHRVVGVEFNIIAAQKAFSVLQTITSKLRVTAQLKALIKALIIGDLGVENFLRKVENQTFSRDLKSTLPHLKVALIEGKVNINCLHQAFNQVEIKPKPFDKTEKDINQAKMFESLAKRTVGFRGPTKNTAEEKVMLIQDLLKGNLSFEEFVLNLEVTQRHQSNVKQCLKHYIMAVFHKQLQAGSLITDLDNLLKLLRSNEKFLMDHRDSLREESERLQFIDDLHGALGHNDFDTFFKKYFSDRPELKEMTVEILNRFRTGDLLIPESLRLPTLHIPEESNDENRENDDLRTPSPVDDGHGLPPSMPIIAQTESLIESDRGKNEELLTQANRILRPGLHSKKQEDNQFQHHLVSVFQKRKLTHANLKIVKENFLLLVNGGMTLKGFLEQKLLMPAENNKLNTIFFESKVKALELPFKDFVDGLKSGSVLPRKLDWSFSDIIFDKVSGNFSTKSISSRPEEAIKLSSTTENQDPKPSERSCRTQLFLDYQLLASWEIKAKEKQRSLNAIFTSSMVIFCPKDRGFNMDIGHEIRNNLFPDGKSGKLFLPSNQKSDQFVEESFVLVKSLRDFEDSFLNINGGAETTTVFEIFGFEMLSHEYEKKNNSEYAVYNLKILHPQQITQDNCCIKMLNNIFGAVRKEVSYQRVVEFICPVPDKEIPMYGFQVTSFAVEMTEFLTLFPDETEYRYFHEKVAFGESSEEYFRIKVCTIGNASILKFMIPSKLGHAVILSSSQLRNDAHLGFIKGKKPFAIKQQDCHIFYSRLPQNRISKIERHKIRKVKSKVECAAKVDLKSSSFFVVYLATQPPDFSEVRRFIIPIKDGEEICDSFNLSAGIYIEQVDTAVFKVSLPLKTSEFRIEKVQMIKSASEVSYACSRKESVLTNTITPAVFEKMTSWTCVHGHKSLKFYHPNIRLQAATPRSPSKSPRSPMTPIPRRLSNSPMSSPRSAPSPIPPKVVQSSPPRQTESPLTRGPHVSHVPVPSPAARPAPTPVSACPSKVTFKVTSAPKHGSPVPVLLTPSSILKRDLVFEVDLYSATLEELYEVPGVDEETAKLITEGRTTAESVQQFVALSKKHKAVFAENIEFSVGRLGRKKINLTYKGTAINKFSYKILMKKKKKLVKKKAIKIDNVENEKEQVGPKNVSDLAAEKDESDERSLTIDEDGVHDETITADEDQTITADEDQTITADEVETETENEDPRTIELESKKTGLENAKIRTDHDLNVQNHDTVDSNEISASVELRKDDDSMDTQDSIDDTANVTERTVPQMAEVERETEKEVTSPPGPGSVNYEHTENDDESPEQNGNTISDNARITDDTLMPDSIQAGSERESEENNNPGEKIVEPQVGHLEPESDAVSEETRNDNDGAESCINIKDKLIEEERFATNLSNEIVIEPVSGPVTSDDDEEDVNDEANFERLKDSAEPTENFIEAISSNEDSDKENNEAYPNVSEVSTAEVGHVPRGSDSANQDLESPKLSNENLIEKELGTRKVTPLKLNINKRKYNQSQSLTNQSTDEENTEPHFKKAKKKRRKRRKIVKPRETSMKRQSTLDEHFPKKNATKDPVVENILPMKLFMKPVVRVERSKEVEDFLHLSNNNHLSEKGLDLSRITLYEFFNADENDPRLEMIQIHRPLQFQNIRPPKQLEKPLVKKFTCSACGEIFGSHKERANHYHVHRTPGEASEIPSKKNLEYQCNLCKQFFRSFDEKREHYYGVHASKSTETSQEDDILEANDNDMRISPVIIEPPTTSDTNLEFLEQGPKDSCHSAKTVEELLAEADNEPTQNYDVQQVLKTMEDVTCLDLSCDKLFPSKSEMLKHYRSLHVKMSDEEDG